MDTAIDGVTGLLLLRCPEICDPGARGLAEEGGYGAIRAGILGAVPRVGSGAVTLTGTMLDQATLLALREPERWESYLDALGMALDGEGRAVWTVAERQFFTLDRSVYYVYYSTIGSDLDHEKVRAAMVEFLSSGDARAAAGACESFDS